MATHALLAALTLTLTFTAALSVADASYWLNNGKEKLLRTLCVEHNTAQARNVILFIGDGMSVATVTAARIYQGQQRGGSGEENSLSFEKFPHVGLSKTYSADKQVPDSASTATALLTGVKVNYGTLGLDASAAVKSCAADDVWRRLDSVMTWAQRAGKGTGVVTTTRITHATPGASYAHINDRDWECDSEVPPEQRECVKDIARQLVQDAPGNNFDVIMGGGLKQLGVPHSPEADAGDDENTCTRLDGLNLADVWLKGDKRRVFVNTSEALMATDLSQTDRLLGLFSGGNFPYFSQRTPQQPGLVNMTLQAIRLLSKNKKGFVLLVEAGMIDYGHHANQPKLALDEALELDDAVVAALGATDPKDTLIVVTADHSHVMTINGYPKRGESILGFANKPGETPYETLTYANGPGYSSHRVNGSAASATNDTWADLTRMNRTDPEYRHMSAIYLEDDTHGGDDVIVFSTGPFSHLLTGAFEQSYVAHAISYAACVGPYATLCGKGRAAKEAGTCSSGAARGGWTGAVGVMLGVVVGRRWLGMS